MKGLFQDLRKARPEQVDSFWDTQTFDVVATKVSTNGILLHQPVHTQHEGQWFFQGQPLAVQGSVEELLIVTHMPDISVGDQLGISSSHSHHSTSSPMFRALLETTVDL